MLCGKQSGVLFWCMFVFITAHLLTMKCVISVEIKSPDTELNIPTDYR